MSTPARHPNNSMHAAPPGARGCATVLVFHAALACEQGLACCTLH